MLPIKNKSATHHIQMIMSSQKQTSIGQVSLLISLQSTGNIAPNRCSIFFQQENILFMINMNDKSSESLSADGDTNFYICLNQNN